MKAAENNFKIEGVYKNNAAMVENSSLINKDSSQNEGSRMENRNKLKEICKNKDATLAMMLT